jgi:hypothetical protein
VTIPPDILKTAQSITARISDRMEASPTLGAAATEVIAEALMARDERAARICDMEAAALQRVADFLKPPRAEYDPQLAEMHEQGAAVASRLALAIRSGEQP